MTLYELSMDYYTTCAGLTRRIESLRKNRHPDDTATEAKIRHYTAVRNQLRSQARLMEHYYDRGYPRRCRRSTARVMSHDC
ncbi:MAG: hypothetical protein E7430_03295 [Ruminococcaceae bacterium]|nr:hypothetical protein [Oscillospiraceae bacterium]